MRAHKLTIGDFEKFEPEADLASDHGKDGKWKYLSMRTHAATRRVRFTVQSLTESTAVYETLEDAIRDFNQR